jgi:hypothetical protein
MACHIMVCILFYLGERLYTESPYYKNLSGWYPHHLYTLFFIYPIFYIPYWLNTSSIDQIHPLRMFWLFQPFEQTMDIIQSKNMYQHIVISYKWKVNCIYAISFWMFWQQACIGACPIVRVIFIYAIYKLNGTTPLFPLAYSDMMASSFRKLSS